MIQNYFLPVDNFRRFVPICSSTFVLIILLFISQEVITWTKIGLFAIALILAGSFFFLLYRRVKVDKASFIEEGLEIISGKNYYLIEFIKIKSIIKVINYGFNSRFKYSISYVINFEEKFSFGYSLYLKYPCGEKEPKEVTALRQRWLESQRNDNANSDKI